MTGVLKQFSRYTLQILTFICIFLVSSAALAYSGSVLDLATPSERAEPARFIEYFEDFSGQLTINDIASKAYQTKFIPLKGDFSFGFSQAVVWSRVAISNNSDQDNWYLRFYYPATAHLSLFVPNNDASFKEQTRSFYDDFATRDVADRLMSFHLSAPIGEQQIVYMRHQTKSTISFRSQILSEKEWIKTIVKETFYHSLFYGILALVCFASLLFAIRTRLAHYLYIVVACIGLVLVYGLFDGYVQTVFGVVTGRFTLFPLGLIAASCAIIAMLSYQRYLQPELNQKKLYRYSYYVICCFWVGLSAFTLLGYPLSIEPALFVFGYLLSASYSVILAYISFLAGNQKVRYFVIGLALFMLGCLAQGTYALGLLDHELVKFEGLRIGIAALVISMLLSLRDYVDQLQKHLDHIHRIASALSKHMGEDFFKELALRLAEMSQCDYIIITRHENNNAGELTSVAYCVEGSLIDHPCPTILGAPGLNVFNQDSCAYLDNVQSHFPDDDYLINQNIHSYLGKALLDTKGKPIGLIAVFDSKPIDKDNLDSLLNIFSPAAALELERVRNDLALEGSLQKLALHAENTRLGVIQLDIDNCVVDWNQAAIKIFGYSKDEVYGRSAMLSVFSGLSETQVGSLLCSHTSTEQHAWQHIRKDGTQIACEWFITPLIDDDKELGYAALVADVTKEREMLSALLSKQREQSEILNSMVDAVITIDERGLILSFNHSAEILFGYSSNDVIGENVKLLMADSIAEQHNGYLSNYTQTGQANIIGRGREVEGKCKNGEFFPLALSVSELPESQEGGRRFIGSCRDLTRVKQQEQLLRQSQKLDALGKLTGGIAHDFNNLLGIISGYTSLLSGLFIEEDNAEKYIGEIEHATERGAQLTKKLLYLSKKRAIDTQDVDLNNILRDMEQVLERTMTPSIKIKFSLDVRIMVVRIDPNYFEDTVINLCINAMHAMEGEGDLFIETKTGITVGAIQSEAQDVKPGMYASFTVRDTGYGIAKPELEKIFEPFYSTKGDAGTGLGLSQVYSFIKQSGGFIEARSELGIGTALTLYFPQDLEVVEGPIQNPVLEENRELSGKETILVVDDEQALLNATSEILSQQGYNVLASNSPIEALGVLKNQDIDLLLSDVIMPNMDGFELAKRAIEMQANIKVQLVSGFVSKTNTLKNKALNDNILHKPFKSKELLLRVREILDLPPNNAHSTASTHKYTKD